jgi:hypothetical protein
MVRTVISVQFKDKNKVFRGRNYDYILNREEEIPEKGAIVRLLDDDYNYVVHGTRLKINDIQEKDVNEEEYVSVRYIRASLDD